MVLNLENCNNNSNCSAEKLFEDLSCIPQAATYLYSIINNDGHTHYRPKDLIMVYKKEMFEVLKDGEVLEDGAKLFDILYNSGNSVSLTSDTVMIFADFKTELMYIRL